MRLPDSSVMAARRGFSSIDLQVLHRLAEAEDHVGVAHLVDQLVHDLAI